MGEILVRLLVKVGKRLTSVAFPSTKFRSSVMKVMDLAAALDPAVPEQETRLKVRARMINWTP